MRIVILKLDVKTENPVKVNLLCRSIYIMNPEKANEIVIWLKNHVSKRDKNTFCNPIWISYKFSFVKKIWHYLECLLVLSLSTYSTMSASVPNFDYYISTPNCTVVIKKENYDLLNFFLYLNLMYIQCIIKYTIDIISTKTRQDQFLFWGYIQNTKDRPEIMFSSIYFFNFRVKNMIYLIYFTLSGIYFSTCYLSLYYWPLSYRLKVNDW